MNQISPFESRSRTAVEISGAFWTIVAGIFGSMVGGPVGAFRYQFSDSIRPVEDISTLLGWIDAAVVDGTFQSFSLCAFLSLGIAACAVIARLREMNLRWRNVFLGNAISCAALACGWTWYRMILVGY